MYDDRANHLCWLSCTRLQLHGGLVRTEFPEILKENVARPNLSSDALAELAEFGKRMASGEESVEPRRHNEMVNSIQDPRIVNSVSEITKMAAKNRYGRIYWTAAAIVRLSFLVPS